MSHFVFCHGFGFDTNFWERISPYFSQEKCSFIDLGYFNNRIENQYLCNQSIIGIGHSIGLSKLICMYDKFDCLIGLNSFINFLGTDQIIYKKRQRELKTISSSFLQNPDSTLKNFYLRCGAPELISYNNFLKLNLDLILSDLRWLEKEYKLPEVPTLILSSDDDIIVPYSITLDNFSKQPLVKQYRIMDAGHILSFRKPLKVYEKIMSFLNDRTT